jgi:hypothetical protein
MVDEQNQHFSNLIVAGVYYGLQRTLNIEKAIRSVRPLVDCFGALMGQKRTCHRRASMSAAKLGKLTLSLKTLGTPWALGHHYIRLEMLTLPTGTGLYIAIVASDAVGGWSPPSQRGRLASSA